MACLMPSLMAYPMACVVMACLVACLMAYRSDSLSYGLYDRLSYSLY